MHTLRLLPIACPIASTVAGGPFAFSPCTPPTAYEGSWAFLDGSVLKAVFTPVPANTFFLSDGGGGTTLRDGVRVDTIGHVWGE